AGATRDDALSGFLTCSRYIGPYPLFNAALNAIETYSAGSPLPKILPFLFAPIYSGFEPFTINSKPDEPGAGYRPTQELAGGISIGTAMALTEPFRQDPVRPPSTAVAFLWTLFDLRSGRWLGNPCREDKWQRSCPLSGLAYPLVEKSGARNGQP